MQDFKIELLRILESAVPELCDKIQAGAVDATTKPPYAAFNTPEETPIRTLHGIVGYTTSFELAVFHPQMSECERLKKRCIKALENTELQGQTCRYKSSEYGYYMDYSLHSYSLTFRIQ